MSPRTCCNLDNEDSDLQEYVEMRSSREAGASPKVAPVLRALDDGSKQADDWFSSAYAMPAAPSHPWGYGVALPSQQTLLSHQTLPSQQDLVQQQHQMQYLQQQAEQQRQMQLHYQRQEEERLRQRHIEQEQLQMQLRQLQHLQQQNQRNRPTRPKQMQTSPNLMPALDPQLMSSARLAPRPSPQCLDTFQRNGEGAGPGSAKQCPSGELTYANVPVVMFDEEGY
eukprot:TRINITY_DN19397_c0_g2_i2.p1 TRINITY_DN19397_c0_g2~~TRINITY_DN19397_c0_g2_i2.p1  ORF type:complete len:245 (-),score=53.10 TRINITY_DN19397_c0_g2_i2:49-723(-)